MSRFLWSCASILTLFVSVESLTCHTCDASVLGYCLSPEPVNCSKTETQCYSGVAMLSGVVEEIYSKGCTSVCSNSTEPIFNNTNVNLTVVMHCCNTNLCNGAGPGLTPLSVVSTLGALLLALGMHSNL